MFAIRYRCPCGQKYFDTNHYTKHQARCPKVVSILSQTISDTVPDKILTYHSITMNSSEEFNMQLEDCPVCFNLKATVPVCNNNHSLCVLCCKKVAICPLCRAPKSIPIQNSKKNKATM